MGKKRVGREARAVIRLHAVVEGQTEETFVRDLLAPHARRFGVAMDCRAVETSRKGGVIYRGGLTRYAKVSADLLRWIREDPGGDAYFTTFFDLFRFPRDAPGYAESLHLEPAARALHIANAMAADLAATEAALAAGRCFPHVQPYEFEVLLFSEPAAICGLHDHWAPAAGALRSLRREYGNPERINSAQPPSYRLKRLFRDYHKITDGVRIAQAIGLASIRRECPCFDAWLSRIEGLAA